MPENCVVVICAKSLLKSHRLSYRLLSYIYIYICTHIEVPKMGFPYIELQSQAIFHIIPMDIFMAIGLSYFSEQWEGVSKGIQSVKHLTPTILMTTVDYSGRE